MFTDLLLFLFIEDLEASSLSAPHRQRKKLINLSIFNVYTVCIMLGVLMKFFYAANLRAISMFFQY